MDLQVGDIEGPKRKHVLVPSVVLPQRFLIGQCFLVGIRGFLVSLLLLQCLAEQAPPGGLVRIECRGLGIQGNRLVELPLRNQAVRQVHTLRRGIRFIERDGFAIGLGRSIDVSQIKQQEPQRIEYVRLSSRRLNTLPTAFSSVALSE